MAALQVEIIWLLIVAAAVAMATRWVRIPYTIALVLAGVAVGFFDVFPDLHLTPFVVFHLFLPVLLFEAAYHLQYPDLKRDAGPVFLMAGPGLLLAAATTGGLFLLAARLTGTGGVTLPLALLFGALISATDPISVIAVFRELGVPRRLANIVEGESLFNDGTAVVVFGILLELAAGGEVTLQSGLREFLVVVAGGALIGLTLGLVFSKITAMIDDHLIEITLTTILAFAAYLAAEEAHVSGVISVVTAGLMVGNYGSRTGMSSVTRVSVGDFWEYAAFVVNSAVFLLIGIEVKAAHLAERLPLILLAFAAVTAGRAVAVGGTAALGNRLFRPAPASWQAVQIWGGLRGSLSMVLVLSLPEGFPARQVLLTVVFGVVASSLLLQGLTMKPALRRLGLVRTRAGSLDFELRRGDLLAGRAALRRLRALERRGLVTGAAAGELRPPLEERVARLDDEIARRCRGEAEIRDEELSRARRHLESAEKEAVKSAGRGGVISTGAVRELLARIEERGAAPAGGAGEGSRPEAPGGRSRDGGEAGGRDA